MSVLPEGVINRPQIVPSIQTESLTAFWRMFERVKTWEWPAEYQKRVSVDIVDGLYADSLTIALQDLSDLEAGDLLLDYQLMVEEPVDYLNDCYQAKAARVLAHVEKMGSRELFLEAARDYPFEAGLALDIFTPVDELSKAEIKAVPVLLLMAVKTGFSGQTFNPLVLTKVRELRARGFAGDIVLDGGQNLETIPFGLASGANQFAVTSGIWQAENPELAWKELKKLVRPVDEIYPKQQ